MALENTLETLEGLSDRTAALYSENNGKFELDEKFRGPDTAALLSAKNHEKEAKQKALDELIALRRQQEEQAIELATAKGDTKEADKLRQEALDRQKAAHDAELAKDKQKIHELTIGLSRDSVAAEVYLNPQGVNLSSLESRIKLQDDGLTTYFVNALGETITRETLIDELRADEKMAFAIRAGNASGGGGGGGDPTDTTASSKLSEKTMDEKVAFYKSKRKRA